MPKMTGGGNTPQEIALKKAQQPKKKSKLTHYENKSPPYTKKYQATQFYIHKGENHASRTTPSN